MRLISAGLRSRVVYLEFLTFLKKHEIEYDPRYVWG